MGSARPWQIILFLVALLALSGGLFLSCRGGVNLADSILMVDVKTGDRFRIDTSGKRATGIPARHPDTGKETLLPIVERDGAWYLAEHYRSGLEYIEGENPAVDMVSYEIRISDASIRSGR